MMRKIISHILVGSVCFVASVFPVCAEDAFGITGAAAGTTLIRFDTATPGTVTTIGTLTGIVGGHAVRGIDFRPADGRLYAFSASGTAGQLYTVNLATAALTPVGTLMTFPASLPARVSMDFNPVVDRLRLVTAAGTNNNFRINPNDGTLVATDGNLAYAAGDPQAATTPFVIGAAYTNNFVGASSTTLYSWDFNTDTLATIGSVGGSPTNPNTGTMFTVFTQPIFVTNDGGLGFDISQATGTAFLSYNNGTAEVLETINLTTGLLTNIGTFGGGNDVLDISITVAAVPEPGTIALVAVLGAGLGGYALRRKYQAKIDPKVRR